MEKIKNKVLNEKLELNAKIEKLQKFSLSDEFNNIDSIQKGLLLIQLDCMRSYSSVLEERLNNMFE